MANRLAQLGDLVPVGFPLRRRSLDFLIICAVLLISIVLPFMLSSNRQMLLLVGVLGLMGLLLLIHRPLIGLPVAVVTGLVIPSPTLPGGANYSVLLVIVLIGLWLMEMFLHHRAPQFLTSRVTRPLFAFLLISVLSFIVGQLPWFASVSHAPMTAQLGGLFIFVLSIGLFFVVADQVRDLFWLKITVWVFLLLGALFIAGWLVPGFGKITGQLFIEHATSNAMFWTWMVALSFSQAVYNRKLGMFWRLVLFTFVGALIYVAFIRSYGWKSGWMPAFAVIGAVLAFRSWRLASVLGLLAIVPVLYLSSQAIATDEYSYSTRYEAWALILEMLRVNPVLGFGPANYYWYTPLYPIRGYEVQFNSHSQYVDIAAQTGILGLGCIAWFFGEMGLLAWRLRNRAEAGFEEAYIYGVIAGLCGMLVAGVLVDWFFPFVYNIGLRGFRSSVLAWLFLGGLLSIEQRIRRRETLEDN